MENVLKLSALAAGLAGIGLIGIFTLITGSPPTPSSRRARAALLALLPAEQAGLVLEMGSGFGGLARALAEQHPQATVVGYERSPLPWLVSRLWLVLRPQANLRFVRADFRSAPLGEARTVVCYLVGPAMKALAPLLAKRLSPGAAVLSCVFALPGWLPIDRGQSADIYGSPVYLYRFPQSLPGCSPEHA